MFADKETASLLKGLSAYIRSGNCESHGLNMEIDHKYGVWILIVTPYQKIDKHLK